MAALERKRNGSFSKGAVLTGKCREGSTADGTLICSSSGAVRNIFSSHPFFLSAPEDVYEEIDTTTRWLQMGFFLCQHQELRMLAALNPSTILTFLKILHDHREELAQSIKIGIAPRSQMKANSSEEVSERILAAQKIAGRLAPSSIWPHLDTICIWRSAGAQHYLPTFEKLSPTSTLWPMHSASTEAALLVPLAESHSGGYPSLRATYFEWFEAGGSHKDCVPIEELDIDKSYRVAVTNFRGLFRYLLEDEFRVVEKPSKTPILELVGRIGMTSSLTGEKLTSTQIMSAVASIEKNTIDEFQVCPVWGDPPAYVLIVSLSEMVNSNQLESWLRIFEDTLCDLNNEYRSKRKSHRLGVPRMWITDDGFLNLRRALTEDQNRSDAQYKHVHLQKNFVDEKNYNIVQKVILNQY